MWDPLSASLRGVYVMGETQNVVYRAKSFGFMEWNFPPPLPWGGLGEGSLFLFHSCKVSLWTLISWASQRFEAPGWGGMLDYLWRQFWRMSPWCKWHAHSVACPCFWPQLGNHELPIDLSLSSSYLLIFNCCTLFFVFEVSGKKKEAAWYNWKSTGLMSHRPAWLCHLSAVWPQTSFFGKWKMEPKYLCFKLYL